MVNRNLLRQFDLNEEDFAKELNDTFSEDPDKWLPNQETEFDANKIVTGRVLNIVGDEVWVDVGYKSEGVIPLEEWKDDSADAPPFPKIGDEIQVLLESVEDESGAIVLSYRKAKRQKEWEDVISRHKEGDVVSGLVTRKIKGGLLVNIGVNVFLPASQVDVRRPPDIGDYINRTIECSILKIDEQRRNIVVSRRKLIEDRRKALKERLLSEIAPGQIRKGIVKNIADFGAFVDLGGIDGLLHITDMSWKPHQRPQGDDGAHRPRSFEVYIINVDKEKEKIALGLKQKQPSPWQNVADKYPVASRHWGEVVNVKCRTERLVKLEDGIEGLVHISEMSWTQPHQSPERARLDRRQDRSAGPQHQQGQAGDLAPGIKQGAAEPVGQGRRTLPGRHAGRGRGPQPHQLRGSSSRSRKASTASCTSSDMS